MLEEWREDTTFPRVLRRISVSGLHAAKSRERSGRERTRRTSAPSAPPQGTFLQSPGSGGPSSSRHLPDVPWDSSGDDPPKKALQLGTSPSARPPPGSCKNCYRLGPPPFSGTEQISASPRKRKQFLRHQTSGHTRRTLPDAPLADQSSPSQPRSQPAWRTNATREGRRSRTRVPPGRSCKPPRNRL